MINDLSKNAPTSTIRDVFKEEIKTMVKSKDYLLGNDLLPHNLRFNSGDLVRIVKTGELGFVIGPLNAFPFSGDVIGELESSRDVRFLVVILNGTALFKDALARLSLLPANSNSSSSAGYFSVRYPKASGLELLVREDKSSSTDTAIRDKNIEKYCNEFCILECDKECPLYKIKISLVP